MGNAGYGNHTEHAPGRPDRDADRQGQPDRQPGKDSPGAERKMPAAGPHAKPSLTNPDATPGTGALTPPGDDSGTDSVTG